MKKLVIISMLFCLAQVVTAQKLKKIWEVQTLEAPESVVYHNGAYYVSNVSGQPAEKNEKGFITKLNSKGEIIQLKWLEGFNAPKGLGIFKNYFSFQFVKLITLFFQNGSNGLIVKIDLWQTVPIVGVTFSISSNFPSKIAIFM